MELGNHHYLTKECVAGIYPEFGLFHVILFDLAQTFTGDPVKIFENAFSFKCVTDFRVPLKPIDMLIGKGNRFSTADRGIRKTGKSRWYP
jgi:hypothetical protein